VEGKVLIVEPQRSVRRALTHVFEQRGYVVVGAENAAGASRLPHRFHCGVFADLLPDASALALAGWFLAEQRVKCVVFFGQVADVDFRLRASNLGSFVGRDEGLHRLERAVAELLPIQVRRVGNGGVSQPAHWGTDSTQSGPRRRFQV
jgi:DNA-binding NtrC family response regulator